MYVINHMLMYDQGPGKIVKIFRLVENPSKRAIEMANLYVVIDTSFSLEDEGSPIEIKKDRFGLFQPELYPISGNGDIESYLQRCKEQADDYYR